MRGWIMFFGVSTLLLVLVFTAMNRDAHAPGGAPTEGAGEGPGAGPRAGSVAPEVAVGPVQPPAGPLLVEGLSDPEIVLGWAQLGEVSAPMEKRPDATAQGGFCLTVPEGPAHQELHPADRDDGNGGKVPNGTATFNFLVEQEGDYLLWAHKNWGHSCADSFRFALDGGPLLDFISGSNHGVWEWVTLPARHRLRLSKGRHTLTIANREDGFRLDALLLTTGAHQPAPLQGGAGAK